MPIATIIKPTLIDRPRYDAARAYAMNVLRHFGFPDAPIPAKEIVKFLGYQMKYAKLCGPDGYTIKCYTERIRYFIWLATDAGDADVFVNARRRRWTLAHELGHILMHGNVDWNTTKEVCVSKKLAAIYEAEADWFASRLLMPNYVITCADDLEYRKLARKCDVNPAAAYRRIKTIRAELATVIQEHQENGKFTYGTRVSTREGAVFNVKWHGVETTDFGRLTICPHCEYSTFVENEDYCPICGLHLFNDCANDSPCDQINSGFARYCQICGHKTTLYAKKYLTEPEEYLT
ncbi:MAG: ImmA/IrrE family metallo-endopeptidase [Bacilli bacterium]